MIVDCALYQDGKRREGPLALGEAAEIAAREGGFVWVDLKDPTSEEFEEVHREFSLHELAVEDALEAHQRPKLEEYGDSLFAVIKTAAYIDSNEVVELGEINVFIGATFVVAVRHGPGCDLPDVRRRVESRPDLLSHGPGAVFYALLDHVVDDYYPVVDAVDEDIQQVETQVFSDEESTPTQRIYYLKREVLQFHTAISSLGEPLDQLARGTIGPVAGGQIPDGLGSYFRDVADHLARVLTRVASQRDLLTSILEANLTQVSLRQNEDMRKISAWVAIAAVPTAVAGIYGMNFDHMPELRSPLGYPLTLLFILVACLYLYRRFKRSGWL